MLTPTAAITVHHSGFGMGAMHHDARAPRSRCASAPSPRSAPVVAIAFGVLALALGRSPASSALTPAGKHRASRRPRAGVASRAAPETRSPLAAGATGPTAAFAQPSQRPGISRCCWHWSTPPAPSSAPGASTKPTPGQRWSPRPPAPWPLDTRPDDQVLGPVPQIGVGWVSEADQCVALLDPDRRDFFPPASIAARAP